MLMVQCNQNHFQSMIDASVKSDGCINQQEFQELLNYVTAHADDRKFAKFFNKESIEAMRVQKYLEKQGHTLCVVSKEQASLVKIYLESSASMDGYLQGNTAYKNDIIDFLINLKSNPSKIKWSLNYITDKVIPIEKTDEITDLNNHLSLAGFRKAEGRASSDLSQIIKTTTTDLKEGEVAMLISDMIYSIDGANVADLLANQKSYIKDTFNQLLQKHPNFEASIIQLNSAYSGIYYSYDNAKTQLNLVNRPYYMLLVGDKHNLDEVVANLKQDKNVVNIFRFQKALGDAYYSFLKANDDEGSYKNDKIVEGAVHGITDIKLKNRREEKFSFTVGVDFSSAGIATSYLEDIKNYEIHAGKYKMVAITASNDNNLHQSSLNVLSRNNQKITHLIRFEAMTDGYTDLSFSLLKNIPAWVAQSATTDDRDIHHQLNTTFGFDYLFKGIFESYQNAAKTPYYKTFDLKLKN